MIKYEDLEVGMEVYSRRRTGEFLSGKIVRLGKTTATLRQCYPEGLFVDIPVPFHELHLKPEGGAI